MRKLESNSLAGEYLTKRQAAELTNLGLTTVDKIAIEAGAKIKIGKCARYKRSKLLEYIESTYTEQGRITE